MPTGTIEKEQPCLLCGARFIPKNNRQLFCDVCKLDARYFGRTNCRRFSGKFYKNSAERIEELKEKYADGIPEGTVESMVNKIFNRSGHDKV